MQIVYIEISQQIVYSGKKFGSYFYILRICEKRITWSNKIVITSSVARDSKIITEKIDGANKFPDSYSISQLPVLYCMRILLIDLCQIEIFFGFVGKQKNNSIGNKLELEIGICLVGNILKGGALAIILHYFYYNLCPYWSILVSICDGSIFQKYVGPNYFTVKLAVEETQICDLATQIANLLDPPPEQICDYTTAAV